MDKVTQKQRIKETKRNAEEDCPVKKAAGTRCEKEKKREWNVK